MAATVIAGYYGFGNAGDELILLSLVRELRRKDPSTRIIVFSNNPSLTTQQLGVEAVHRWKPWRWLPAFLQSDRFWLGGGGLLQETSGPWNHAYYLLLPVLAKLCGCRTEAIALGVDPIRLAHNRFLARWTFNHWMDQVSVRDAASYEALIRCGVRTPIVITADPVFSLQLEAPQSNEERVACAFSASTIGSVQDIAAFLNLLGKQFRMPMDLLVLFPDQDAALANEIASAAATVDRVRVVSEASQLLSWVSDYKLVLGSRFHALVLASRAGIPFIGLGAQSKVYSLCASKGMPHVPSLEPRQHELLLKQASALLKSKSSILST